MADIDFDTLSDATTVGTGTATDGAGNFDELMKVVTLHLEKQFTDGRITGTDYATVYLGALQSTLAQAVNFTINMNKANEEATLPVTGSVAGKQITLFTEQAKGFKWNAENKYLKSLLDAYAINVSVSKSDDTATLLLQGGNSDTGIDKIIDDMKPTG